MEDNQDIRTMYFVYDEFGNVQYNGVVKSFADAHALTPGSRIVTHTYPHKVKEVPVIEEVVHESEPEAEPLYVIPEPEEWIPKTPPPSESEVRRAKEARLKELKDLVNESKGKD